MLHSVVDQSKAPLFPLNILINAKRNFWKKQSEDCFIASRFIEFLIAKIYSLEAPFVIKSIKEIMIDAYGALLINDEFLLFVKEYLDILIDLKFITEIKEDIDHYAELNSIKPVYVFISYENTYIGGSEWFGRRTGCYLLDRKEISDFVFQFNLHNAHWQTFQNNLQELDNCTNSQNVHERKVYRQAAEGFFMRVSELINKENTLKSGWYYNENSILSLSVINSKDLSGYSILITNAGVFKTFIDTNFIPECEETFTYLQEHFLANIDLDDDFIAKQLTYNQLNNNHLFELDSIDWLKSEWEISEELVKLQASIQLAYVDIN